MKNFFYANFIFYRLLKRQLPCLSQFQVHHHLLVKCIFYCKANMDHIYQSQLLLVDYHQDVGQFPLAG